MAKYPAMKVVQKQPANLFRSEGMDLMQNWTGNGEAIDIVAANNDEMAIGAAMALEKSRKEAADRRDRRHPGRAESPGQR